MPEPIKVRIVCDGGLVGEVYCDTHELTIELVDLDVEDTSESELEQLTIGNILKYADVRYRVSEHTEPDDTPIRSESPYV